MIKWWWWWWCCRVHTRREALNHWRLIIHRLNNYMASHIRPHEQPKMTFGTIFSCYWMSALCRHRISTRQYRVRIKDRRRLSLVDPKWSIILVHKLQQHRLYRRLFYRHPAASSVTSCPDDRFSYMHAHNATSAQRMMHCAQYTISITARDRPVLICHYYVMHSRRRSRQTIVSCWSRIVYWLHTSSDEYTVLYNLDAFARLNRSKNTCQGSACASGIFLIAVYFQYNSSEVIFRCTRFRFVQPTEVTSESSRNTDSSWWMMKTCFTRLENGAKRTNDRTINILTTWWNLKLSKSFAPL